MENLLLIFAVLIVVTTLYDIFVTVLSHNGAGPITSSWTAALWKVALFAKYELGNKFLIRRVGPLMIIGVLIVWYILIYISWFIFFYLGNYSIKGAADDSGLKALDIIYYIGSTFSTLGIGDIVPNGFPWTLISTSGALLVTLLVSFAISYFIPIVGAVADRRKLVARLNNIGKSAQEVLDLCWTGPASRQLDPIVVSIADGLVKESYKSQVYPVLEYFYFKETGASVNLNILSLYDALIFQDIHKQREDNAAWSVRLYILRSIDSYIQNFSRNESYKKRGFSYSHDDFVRFLNSYDEKEKVLRIKDIDKHIVEKRQCLLNFAHHEGRLKPVDNQLSQKLLPEKD